MKKVLIVLLIISSKAFGQTSKMEVVVSATENVDGIKVTSKNTTPSSYNYSIYGLNKSTNYNGVGVYGGHEGNGTGVLGWSKNGHGVYGFSQFSTGGSGVYGLVYGVDRSGVRGYSENGYGNGVLGEAESGIGVKGHALNYFGNAGIGGHFSNAFSTGYALVTGTGKLKFAGPGVGTLGTDKFLKSINVNGDAEWSDLLPLSISKSNTYALLNVTNLNTGAFNGADFSTQSTTFGSGIVGKATSLNPTSDNKGISGENHSTNTYGYGVFGEHYGYGTAVYGLSAAGKGVHGYSGEGIGGYFTSTSGYALITEAGKVGIGTTAPTAKMDIKGSVKFSHFYFGANEDTYIRGGKAGSKVLINDESGMGSVGIGLSNPNEILDINGRMRIRHNTNTSGLWMSNSTNSLNGADGAFYGMKTDTETGVFIGGTWRFWVNSAGNGYLNGNLIQTSDKRLKKDFLPLNNSLSNIYKLNGYHYKWIEESRSKDLQTGLIAQEVQWVFPELVQTDEKGFLSVNYIGLVPHLIEAVKELRNENNALKNNNHTLTSRLDKIEAMLTTLQPNTENLNSKK